MHYSTSEHAAQKSNISYLFYFNTHQHSLLARTNAIGHMAYRLAYALGLHCAMLAKAAQ